MSTKAVSTACTSIKIKLKEKRHQGKAQIMRRCNNISSKLVFEKSKILHAPMRMQNKVNLKHKLSLEGLISKQLGTRHPWQCHIGLLGHLCLVAFLCILLHPIVCPMSSSLSNTHEYHHQWYHNQQQ